MHISALGSVGVTPGWVGSAAAPHTADTQISLSYCPTSARGANNTNAVSQRVFRGSLGICDQ